MPNDLAQPITIQGVIKSTRMNADTGERVVTISFPATEAAKVAHLSIMDQIVFDIRFTPVDAQSQRF